MRKPITTEGAVIRRHRITMGYSQQEVAVLVGVQIYGMSVADAVGVPAEFMRRSVLQANPITEMIGGGAHQQKAGTWSDDTSIALCLAFSFCRAERY